MGDTHGHKVPENQQHEVIGNARWPVRTSEAARRVVVEAAMHMTTYRDGIQGVTVARNQFSAKWSILDQFGQPPDEEPFVMLQHRPEHEIIGYYKTVWPNEVQTPESLGDVFVCPEILPGEPQPGELRGNRSDY
jgi:hypothetical protein